MFFSNRHLALLLSSLLLTTSGKWGATAHGADLVSFDRGKASANAAALNELVANTRGSVDLPSGFFFYDDTLKLVSLAGRSIRGGGASYGLPTARYDDANTGSPTVLCYIGPEDKPAVLVACRNLELTGVQIQRGEFYRGDLRDTAGKLHKNKPLWKLSNGEVTLEPQYSGVGIEFRRTPLEAPGGRAILGSVSFVGWECAIRLADESNMLLLQMPQWDFCKTCIRSEHNQNFGVHVQHGVIDSGVHVFADLHRGGLWDVDYLYTNSPVVLVKFSNISANYSSLTIKRFYPDHNAKGWRLVECVDKGKFSLKVGGHVTKGGAPAADWIKLNGSPKKCVNITGLSDPYGVLPLLDP